MRCVKEGRSEDEEGEGKGEVGHSEDEAGERRESGENKKLTSLFPSHKMN